jgi:hypothetical protein
MSGKSVALAALSAMPEGLFPERLFLSNRDRWSAPK